MNGAAQQIAKMEVTIFCNMKQKALRNTCFKQVGFTEFKYVSPTTYLT